MFFKAASAPTETSSAVAVQGAQDARGPPRTYRDKLFSSLTTYPFLATSFSTLFRREDTCAPRLPEVPRALTESNQAPGSHLDGAGLPQPDPARDRLGEDSNSYSLLRGESAATTGATPHRSYSPTTFSTAAYLQGPNLASFTSPECEPRRGQEVNAEDECPISSCEPNTDDKELALRLALAKAASPAFLYPEAHLKRVAQPASGLSATNPVQEKGEERKCKDAAVESGGYIDNDTQGNNEEDRNNNAKGRASSPQLPRDIPPTIPPKTRRSKTVKPSTASTDHRTLHAARISRKTGHRTLNNSRALQHARTPRSPPVKAARVPVKNAVVNSRRLRQAGSSNQGPGNYHTPRAAITALHPTRNAFPDMEVARHVEGDVVEESLGLNDPLFAKNGEGNEPEPCSSHCGDRHYFFHFPPPDMGDHNRDFDRELEQSRPIYDGLNTDLIDKQLDEFAARTELVVSLMKAHQAELDPVNELFLANKNELAHLNYERQRAITSQYSLLNRTTPRERARIIARVAEAETPLLEEQERVKEELREIVIRGRAKIARILREDLRIPTMIDEKRARASQRKIMEEQYTELGIAGAMIGLRGSLKAQNYSTHTAILRFAQLVVDERLKAFDEKDSWRKPDKPVSVNPVSNVDTAITAVPGWFTILDAKGTVKLRGTAPLDRLKELLQILGTSLNAAREEQWADEFRPNRHTWRKQYHEPNDAWPNALQRSRGGWWACRNGPDASPAERSCKLCHPRVPSPQGQVSAQTARDQYQHILKEIETAQAEASKRDQLMLKYQLQQEREDINRYWQRREWIRSGGGVDVSEVLHGRDVNELNYRPSSGESQSFQQSDTPSRSVEPHDKQALETASAPRVEFSQNSQLLGSFQISELMSRKQIINETPSPPAAGPSSSPRRLGCSPLLNELLTGKPASKLGFLSGESSQPPRRLHGSPLFHELLAGRQVNENPPQAPPPLSLYRLNSSQAHDALHGRLPKSGTSPTQPGPSQLRSSMARPGQKSKKRVSWQL
ncbi:hypothetical protein VTG60DRAFT_3711 [Thermothelomyces hinnuleus]